MAFRPLPACRIRMFLCFGLGLFASFAAAAAAASLPAGIEAAPLAARSAPAGGTMFTTLPPETTGIDVNNPYDDPRMWWQLYREFSLGAIGTGVAIADYDSDGRPDIFFVTKTGTNRLYRNLGDWKFEDVTATAGVAGPGGAWQQGAAFVDANNDGHLDLYVCRFDAPNLFFQNQGDGTFVERAAEVGLALRDASGMSAWADYDRDGWLDVYVQTNVLNAEARPNGQRDRLYRNNGDGTFTEVTEPAGIRLETQGHAATWWDIDEDGWPDLYVDNDFKDPDQLYHNQRDGTFANALSYAVPYAPHSSMGADLGDVNRDGHFDLLIADMAATSRYKDHRGMADLRTGLTENTANPRAAPQYMRNALFLGTGIGIAREAALLAGLDATDWTWSVRLEDLDNDGHLDVHVTNGMVRELHNADLVDRMMATENIQERVRIMKSSPRLDEANLAYRQTGELAFTSVGADWGLDHRGVSFGAALGDLDGDGDFDLVFSNYDAPPTICRNDSENGHRVLVALRGTTSNRFGVGATVRLETASGTQARQVVVARGYNSTSEPVLHFGLGEDAAVKRLVVTWPSGREQTFTDLPANQRYLITEPDTGAAGLAPPPARTAQFRESGEDAGLAVSTPEKPLDEIAQQPLLPWRLNRVGPAAVIADLDEDGAEDALVGGPMGASPQLLRAFGDGRFGPDLMFGLDHVTTTADAGIVAFDVDADGDQDLLVARGGVARPAEDAAYQPILYLNRGRARFAPAPADALPALPISAGPVAVADYNRDGRLDVFLGGRVTPGRYPTIPRSALLENRGGTFAESTSTLAPRLQRVGMVHAALWSDADADGWVDLLLALEWGGVRYFRNVAGRRLSDDTEVAGFAAAGTGWWHSLAAADFNQDGRPDFVAGNGGLNTPYRASARHPVLLYAGEFAEVEQPRIVEAMWEGDTLFPRRSRNPLLAVFPALRQRFPTYESFARATLEEIFSANALAIAQSLAVTELQHGVFLSRPDGTWAFSPLPRIAQIAPVHGIATGDFDGDGFSDIVVVQNSHAPIPEVGRFSGGISQLLRGDGRGGFSPVETAESGLIARFDTRALAVFDPDNDGWPDLLATANNDRTLFFRNDGVDGRHSFGVALQGPAGNPTAIGATITVLLEDGSRQASTVAAGSGYLSQSSPVLFFGYPASNPPREIQVRWPDGSSTTQPWSEHRARIAIAAPEPNTPPAAPAAP